MKASQVKIISLKDEKSKELARVLSNSTAQDILQKLTEMKAIKQISDELSLPLTTVQSNIEKLKKVGLIEQTHYKWSPKGRKQRLYQPAKNIIIFAPEKAHANIIEVLKSSVIIPALMVVAGGVGLLRELSQKASVGASQFARTATSTAIETAEDAVLAAPVAPAAEGAVASTSTAAANITSETAAVGATKVIEKTAIAAPTIAEKITVVSTTNIWILVLFIGLITFGIIWLVYYFRRMKKCD